MARRGVSRRVTGELRVEVAVELDGKGFFRGGTGIKFFDHLLNSLVRHSWADVSVSVEQLVEVDDHHVVEDVGLALGNAVSQALGDRHGIRRFGHAIVPMDDALVLAVVDLSGRPYCVAKTFFKREAIAGMALENIPHFVSALASRLEAAIHVLMLYGLNDHHKAEAVFKALGLALREAWSLSGREDVESTKEVLG